MKNKKLIGHVGVLALALMGILGVAGFAAASDGNANTSDTGVLSDKGALTISASGTGTGTITDASGNEVDIPMIDVSDISRLEGSGWITVSTNGTIVDASGNGVALVLDSSAVTETVPTK